MPNARLGGSTNRPNADKSRRLKTPSAQNTPMVPIPTEIKKTGAHQLTVRWNDGHVSEFQIKYLRSECMCARCVSETTGLRILDPNTVSEDLTILNAEHVGRYGVKFMFSDRHDDGIFTWERLRELCPCSICKPAPDASFNNQSSSENK